MAGRADVGATLDCGVGPVASERADVRGRARDPGAGDRRHRPDPARGTDTPRAGRSPRPPFDPGNCLVGRTRATSPDGAETETLHFKWTSPAKRDCLRVDLAFPDRQLFRFKC